MKKIFTLIASLMMVLSMSAATKTIYCKMAQSWWKADGAAVGAYAWIDGGANNASWPGVRMTPVAGETDLWSVDIDTKYKKIIFTRVNGTGAVSDWGAKTADQTIPTDDKNMFTITSASPVWGNPGCTGTWSTYTPNAPKTYKDITFTITANAAPQIHYWDGGDKMVGSDWENLPTMTATGNANEYTYTVKDVDEATGVKYLLKIGNIQTTDQHTTENVTADFKDLLVEVKVQGIDGWQGGIKMTPSDDYLSASVTYPLGANLSVALKLTVGGEWFGDTKNAITKENNSTVFDSNGSNNGSIKTDISGDYVFTYTYATKTLTVTYPTEEVEVEVNCYVIGNENLTGVNWVVPGEIEMTKDEETGLYTHTFTSCPANTPFEMQVYYANTYKGFNCLSDITEGITANGDNICFTLVEAGDITVTYNAETDKIALTGNFAIPVTYDYYIAGTLAGGWSATQQGMEKEGDVYKATFSELDADIYEFKITDGQFNSEGDNTHEHTTLGAAYEEVSYSDDGNIKITTEEAINLTVIFNAATDKITFEGLTEKAPAEPVTVYFINSGNWAEVACHYWGGLNGSEWPGVQMDLTAETYEAKGWNVYKVTFPGDNTKCVFTDNKATDAKQTADLEVQNGKYYCYANGIWYERLADVDPLDTRVYLKGAMNEWCEAGYCDMFRKEDMSETVAYRTTWLDAETTYEFKIEDAGTWLSNEGTMDKDNCTGWEFTEGANNAKITTEYAGDYTFVWDMTTKKLSVVYPELVPTEMDLVVTNMVFDGDNMTFSGSDNEYGIVFNLVVGDPIEEEEGVFALEASSTVDFNGMPFTDVTGKIAPDMSMGMPTAATAVVYGFLGGSEYYQFNLDMSAGGGTPVEIWDGVATPNDGTGELTISAKWDGDDVYVVVPGFNYENYECPEVWFYVGGTTWETASIAAYGPATITVEDGGVLVEGSVMSGVTGTSYELMVFGLLPVEQTPDYTREGLTTGNYGTICLPFGATSYTGMELYEFVGKEEGKAYLGSVTTLEAGVPYIFLATASELAVYSDGTTAATPGENNGLVGTFTDATEVTVGNYILFNNAICEVTATCWVNANRAYIVWGDIPAGAPQQMPGRKYISMDVQGENETTGIEDLFTTEAPAKVIVNGQLIIIRDGVKYNVQGQKL